MFSKYLLPVVAALAALTTAAPLSIRDLPSFVFDGDAFFNDTAQTMTSTLFCPYGDISSSSNPILLVHGTGSTGHEAWNQSFAPALHADGFDPCYLDLPLRATADAQISASWVAYNLHYISYLAGGKSIAVMGHSQGNPVIQWALRFWKSTRGVVSSYIAISPDFQGVYTRNLATLCEIVPGGPSVCAPSLWQQVADSNFEDALGLYGRKALVPTSSIYTEVDEVVFPGVKTSYLPGAAHVAIQDLCIGRPTQHNGMLFDAAAYALAIDGLKNGGHADRSRVGPGPCFQIFPPNSQITINGIVDTFSNAVTRGILGEPKVLSEPELMSYARTENQVDN